jgi:ABC-2 type transport system ATP-binding protein
MSSIITMQNVSHQYGQKRVLNNISFSVGEGEVFALLGPNGVGKTTTIRLLNGLLKPHSGNMEVLGFDPRVNGIEIRRQVGVLTETPALYERLNALENLNFFGTLAGMSADLLKTRIGELLEFFDLAHRSRDRVGSYSKGMKQRLALARALLIKPRLLYLDEPTSGLDPEAAKQVHELIHNIRKSDGRTVVLCTHHLYEAEKLCDRMAVMGGGRVLAVGSLPQLRAEIAPELKVCFTFLKPIAAEVLNKIKSFAGVVTVESLSTGSLLVELKDREVIPLLIKTMIEAGLPLAAVEPQLAGLEEIYFRLQQRPEEKIK